MKKIEKENHKTYRNAAQDKQLSKGISPKRHHHAFHPLHCFPKNRFQRRIVSERRKNYHPRLKKKKKKKRMSKTSSVHCSLPSLSASLFNFRPNNRSPPPISTPFPRNQSAFSFQLHHLERRTRKMMRKTIEESPIATPRTSLFGP